MLLVAQDSSLVYCIVIQREFMVLRIIKSVNNAKFRVHMDNMKKVVFDDSAAFSFHPSPGRLGQSGSQAMELTAADMFIPLMSSC